MITCGIFICVGERYKILKHPIRGSVGTGRRARLRILWWLHRVGSSPIFRTKDSSRETWVFLRCGGKSSFLFQERDMNEGVLKDILRKNRIVEKVRGEGKKKMQAENGCG